VVGGLVSQNSVPVVVDELNVVPVGVEQEGAVVRRAVLGARPRRAVVAVRRVDAGLPERVDLCAVAGAVAEMKPSRSFATKFCDLTEIPADLPPWLAC
jgi:hypothetical protein